MAQKMHQYYKKEVEEATILVQIDPESMEGIELIILKSGEIQKTVREFDETIYEDLEFDEFTQGNAIEFNLYLKGITN